MCNLDKDAGVYGRWSSIPIINLAPNITHIWKELTVATHANSPCP